MFRNLSTQKLLLFLVILLAVVGGTYFFDQKNGESTFRTELVSVDSSLVTEVLLYPKAEEHREIRLSKNGLNWFVDLGKSKVSADSAAVNRLLQDLLHLKPQRLAGTEKAVWKDFQVDDSAGTKIKINGEKNNLASFVIGKFSYNQQTRGGISYVRLENESDVYAVDGFLPMMVNQKADVWRNKNLVNSKVENFTRLIFQYPADSGFVLSKQGEKWLLNGSPSDSLKTSQFLSGLANLNGSGFVNDFNSTGKTPLFSLKIEGNNQTNPITLNAFSADSVNRFAISTDVNQGVFFSGTTGSLFQRIFISSSGFIPAAVIK